jgi:hypothetical protein
VRHVEELSLMESYQDVKREGLFIQNARLMLVIQPQSSQKMSVVCFTAGSRLLGLLVIAA